MKKVQYFLKIKPRFPSAFLCFFSRCQHTFIDEANFTSDTLREKWQNTEIFWSVFSRVRIEYSISLRIQSKCGKIRTRKNSVFGHFSRSGCECLLVVTDYFSGWTQAYATRNKKYKTAAECLLNDFILRYRMPSNILHDQGGKFENDLFKELGNGGVGITWKVLIFAIFEHFCEIL